MNFKGDTNANWVFSTNSFTKDSSTTNDSGDYKVKVSKDDQENESSTFSITVDSSLPNPIIKATYQAADTWPDGRQPNNYYLNEDIEITITNPLMGGTYTIFKIIDDSLVPANPNWTFSQSLRNDEENFARFTLPSDKNGITDGGDYEVKLTYDNEDQESNRININVTEDPASPDSLKAIDISELKSVTTDYNPTVGMNIITYIFNKSINGSQTTVTEVGNTTSRLEFVLSDHPYGSNTNITNNKISFRVTHPGFGDTGVGIYQFDLELKSVEGDGASVLNYIWEGTINLNVTLGDNTPEKPILCFVNDPTDLQALQFSKYVL